MEVRQADEGPLSIEVFPNRSRSTGRHTGKEVVVLGEPDSHNHSIQWRILGRFLYRLETRLEGLRAGPQRSTNAFPL